MTSPSSPDAISVAARVAHLPHLTMEQLWAMWDDHFDERPPHHQRTWLESRLAYRIQERAFGGVKPSVRAQLEEIGATGLLPKAMRRDANRLLPGTMLMRTFDNVDHRVLVNPPSCGFFCLSKRRTAMSEDQDRDTASEYHQITLRSEDIEDLLDRAAERGAERCLAHLGLENGHAARDIRELRDLLDAWRDARRTAWQTVVKVVTTGLLAALLVGAAIKLKIIGGAP